MDRGSIEARVIKFVISQAENTGGPAVIAAVAVKSGLQVAHNEGLLDAANRSNIPPVAALQESAGNVEDAVDPYFHVRRTDIIRVLPGGQLGWKVGNFMLRNAPIPSQVKNSVFGAVETVFEKIEGPVPPNGSNNGLSG